ncbi:MAG: T9SS type A sorting domain-containing protein [Saprospiraceae bacterium]|nr:T9SS type A sorting domain-containing protein [Candidatus Brachybacter algidus]MBL0119767.1 T9SS type A sorting domain-containing protein [Candidatus Brachybacter algidus]
MITNCVASTSSYNTIKFDIYPNPVEESLTVELGDMLTNNILIQIIDLQGRVVGQTKYLIADKIIQPVKSLSPGIYCIRVMSGKFAGSTKFLKL